MNQRTCPICESTIDPSAHGKRIYCSPKCAKRASNQSEKGRAAHLRHNRNLRLDPDFLDAERNARAEYRQRNIERERAYDHARSAARALAASNANLTGWRALATEPPRQLDAEMDAVDKWRYLACPWCGESFWSRHASAIYCGRPCHDRASRARRRALECGAIGTYTWAEVVAIYRAIGRVCAYCHEYFPLSDIEPDHVIALSVGGSNSITNVAPACKLCNSDKRELSMADWATCRDRRGLEPRTLHPLVSHLTLAML